MWQKFDSKKASRWKTPFGVSSYWVFEEVPPVVYVWISSTPGKGATLDIYLPRVDEAAPPLLGEPEGRSEYPKGTETILVLEDEEAVRAVTCEFLTAGGYTVLQAGRGSLTIEVAQRYKGRIQLIATAN